MNKSFASRTLRLDNLSGRRPLKCWLLLAIVNRKEVWQPDFLSMNYVLAILTELKVVCQSYILRIEFLTIFAARCLANI